MYLQDSAPKETCYVCGRKVLMHLLRSHLVMCSEIELETNQYVI